MEIGLKITMNNGKRKEYYKTIWHERKPLAELSPRHYTNNINKYATMTELGS